MSSVIAHKSIVNVDIHVMGPSVPRNRRLCQRVTNGFLLGYCMDTAHTAHYCDIASFRNLKITYKILKNRYF